MFDSCFVDGLSGNGSDGILLKREVDVFPFGCYKGNSGNNAIYSG